MDMSHMTTMGVAGAFTGAMLAAICIPRGVFFGLMTIGLCSAVRVKWLALPLALLLGIVYATWLYYAHDQYLGYSPGLVRLVFAAKVTGITLEGLIGFGIGQLVRRYLNRRAG